MAEKVTTDKVKDWLSTAVVVDPDAEKFKRSTQDEAKLREVEAKYGDQVGSDRALDVVAENLLGVTGKDLVDGVRQDMERRYKDLIIKEKRRFILGLGGGVVSSLLFSGSQSEGVNAVDGSEQMEEQIAEENEVALERWSSSLARTVFELGTAMPNDSEKALGYRNLVGLSKSFLASDAAIAMGVGNELLLKCYVAGESSPWDSDKPVKKRPFELFCSINDEQPNQSAMIIRTTREIYDEIDSTQVDTLEYPIEMRFLGGSPVWVISNVGGELQDSLDVFSDEELGELWAELGRGRVFLPPVEPNLPKVETQQA